MKTTEKEREEFKSALLTYLDMFGLHEWDISIMFEKLNPGILAETRFQFHNKQATISANTHPRSNTNWKETAFHEAMHILLGEVQYLGTSRYIDDSELPHAIEEVVNRLTNIIYRSIEQ